MDIPEKSPTGPEAPAIIKEHIHLLLQNTCSVSTEMERIEREFIAEALRLSDGNLRKAAACLGIPKSTLFNKLKKYDIKV